MANAAHTIRQELTGIGIFIGAMWGVFALSYVVPSLDQYGIVPRTVGGLAGIVAAPFLHENLGHIVGNTLPLLILLGLLAESKAQSWAIVVEIILLGGFLL
jgi:membrane associated rhomboid family serine protease